MSGKERQQGAPTAARPRAAGAGRLVRRLQSHELFGRGDQASDQVVIERGGREYRLRVTSNTRYQQLAEVMAAVQNAGLQKVGFITTPGEARP